MHRYVHNWLRSDICFGFTEARLVATKFSLKVLVISTKNFNFVAESNRSFLYGYDEWTKYDIIRSMTHNDVLIIIKQQNDFGSNPIQFSVVAQSLLVSD